MDLNKIEEYIALLQWGKRFAILNDGRVFIFRSPNIEEINYANFIYSQSYNRYKKQGMLTVDELLNLARRNDEWDDSDDNYYNRFDDLVKTIKEQSNSEDRLKRANELREEIVDRYNSITSCSIEQIAIEDKIKYLIKCVTEKENGGPLWKTDADFNNETNQALLYQLIGAYLKNEINESIIRKIARSAQWRIRWNVGKENIQSLLGVHIHDLNDQQLSLLYWSQIYDSAYNSMEPPSDEIVEDDDKFDKWLKEKNDEDKRERKNKSFDKQTKKKRGFYDREGKWHNMGKDPMSHKEVGVVLDGEYDDDGYFRPYTMEEKRQKLEEIYGRNSPRVRQMLAYEQNKVNKSGGSLREEQLRKGNSRKIFGK